MPLGLFDSRIMPGGVRIQREGLVKISAWTEIRERCESLNILKHLFHHLNKLQYPCMTRKLSTGLKIPMLTWEMHNNAKACVSYVYTHMFMTSKTSSSTGHSCALPPSHDWRELCPGQADEQSQRDRTRELKKKIKKKKKKKNTWPLVPITARSNRGKTVQLQHRMQIIGKIQPRSSCCITPGRPPPPRIHDRISCHWQACSPASASGCEGKSPQE
jgi:hypothetical protein